MVPFVGRPDQLAQFVGAVNEDPRSAARIVNVSGAAGAGRTRFVEEALSRLTRLGRPNFLVQPELKPGLNGAAFFRALVARLPVAALICTNAASRLEQGSGETGLDETAARSFVNALFHESYDCGLDRRGFVRPKSQRLAIVFDDFDRLPATLIGWIAQHVLPLLHEVREHLDYVLVLVTERSLAGDLEPVAWNALPARFLAVDLPPLAEKESIELLSLFARRASEARMCHEIAEGLPGPMLELLRHRVRSLPDLGAALERCADATANLLVGIAALGVATEEGLRLALGSEALATVGTALQNAPMPVFGSLRNGGLWLPGALVRLVLEKLGPRVPEMTQRARQAAELLEALEASFGTEEERRTAARLRGLRFFNRDALVACFGAREGPELEHFARAHSGGFAETPAGNLRLADGVADLLERYAAATQTPIPPSVREKAVGWWTDRAEEMKRQAEAATGHVRALEKERDDLFADLEKTRQRLGQCENESQSEWKNRLNDDVVRIGVSLLANGAGVVCFWMALFSANQRLSFIVVGGLLIGIGFGTPALSSRTGQVARAAAVKSAQQQRIGQVRGMVNLLEAQTASLQQRLAEERRRGETLRAALDEPLVA